MKKIRKRTYAIGMIVLALILGVIAFGEISGGLNLGSDSYTLECDVTIQNAPLVSPWIDSVSCTSRKSGLFSIWDTIDDIRYDRGYIEVVVQDKSSAADYKVEEFILPTINLCPPFCPTEGEIIKTISVKNLEAGEEEVVIRLYNDEGSLIDSRYLNIIIGGN